MNALQRVFSLCGGQTALAKKLGIRQSAVGNWAIRGRVPAERCPDVERLVNGAVTCEELRPDVDWAYLRGTAKPSLSEPERKAA
jgi:DNA-binding transcriptional regulator YdaS (Cro superfamily)